MWSAEIQPHIISVQHGAPRLLPCVSARETELEERRKEDRLGEVQQQKSQQTRIGGDQWRFWTLEQIYVTAISKTITSAASTRGTRNLLLRTDLIDLTLSHRTPLCRRGRPHRMPAPNQRAGNIYSQLHWSNFKTSGVVTGIQAARDLFPPVCYTPKTSVGRFELGYQCFQGGNDRFLQIMTKMCGTKQEGNVY